jgi:hypothetical protein
MVPRLVSIKDFGSEESPLADVHRNSGKESSLLILPDKQNDGFL